MRRREWGALRVDDISGKSALGGAAESVEAVIEPAEIAPEPTETVGGQAGGKSGGLPADNGNDNGDSRDYRVTLDWACKLLLLDDDAGLLAFLNSVFGTAYGRDSAIAKLSTEFAHSDASVRRGDMHFMVAQDAFHFEFQTSRDDAIAIRLLRYCADDALSRIESVNTLDRGGVTVLELSRPLLIQIGADRALPEALKYEVRVSGVGGRLSFSAPVIKVGEQTYQSLAQLGYYPLLPLVTHSFRARLGGSHAEPAKQKAADELVAAVNFIRGFILSGVEKKLISQAGARNMEFVTLALVNEIIQSTKSANRFDRGFYEMVKTGAERGWYETVRDARLEGELEGERKGKLETARNMLALGMEPKLISRATGLPQETVSKLVQEAAG
jgi:hypothetical protein